MSVQRIIEGGVGVSVAIAAGTDEVWYWTCPHAGTWKIDAIYFVPGTARTAHATNHTDISVKNGSDEISSTLTTAGGTGNLVAGTAIVLAITGVGTTLEVAQGETLSFLKTDAGAGVALDGYFSVSLSQLNA